jgi:hypothetical protein
MRALTTTALVLPATTRLPTARTTLPAVRRVSSWDRLFHRRRKPTLFQRCLAVHMASAGTLSALR